MRYFSGYLISTRYFVDFSETSSNITMYAGSTDYLSFINYFLHIIHSYSFSSKSPHLNIRRHSRKYAENRYIVDWIFFSPYNKFWSFCARSAVRKMSNFETTSSWKQQVWHNPREKEKHQRTHIVDPDDDDDDGQNYNRSSRSLMHIWFRHKKDVQSFFSFFLT